MGCLLEVSVAVVSLWVFFLPFSLSIFPALHFPSRDDQMLLTGSNFPLVVLVNAVRKTFKGKKKPSDNSLFLDFSIYKCFISQMTTLMGKDAWVSKVNTSRG